MRFARTLQSLSLPAAALAAALTLACTEPPPTAPDSAPPLATDRGPRAPLVDDDGRLNCRRGYSLVHSGIGDLSVYDLNGNGYICEYTGGDGGDALYMDDGKRGCKSGYGLVAVSDGAWGKEYDFNGNGFICVLGASAQVALRDALDRIVPSLEAGQATTELRLALITAMEQPGDASRHAIGSALDRLVAEQPGAAVEADVVRLAATPTL